MKTFKIWQKCFCFNVYLLEGWQKYWMFWRKKLFPIFSSAILTSLKIWLEAILDTQVSSGQTSSTTFLSVSIFHSISVCLSISIFILSLFVLLNGSTIYLCFPVSVYHTFPVSLSLSICLSTTFFFNCFHHFLNISI